MNTHYLVSDLEFDIELLTNIKNRVIEQKQLYLEEGASKYYKSTPNLIPRPHSSTGFTNEEMSAFIIEHCVPKENTSMAITSLACGNCQKESHLLKQKEIQEKNFLFLGMDASKTMLTNAEENLNNIAGDVRLVCADFGSTFFRQELSSILQSYHHRIFLFLGNTIGNIQLTNIADTLSNTLKNGDLLLIDVLTRIDETLETDVHIFQKYASYLKIPELTTFYFHPLSRVGIPFENGEMTLQMHKEESTGALRFEFGFLFKVKTQIYFRNEYITILPGEIITLNTIRVYDSQKFLSFFTEHNFTVIASETKNNKMMILFQKNS